MSAWKVVPTAVAMSRARHAYSQGDPGFYVVTPRTQIAVAGPFASVAEAVSTKSAIDATWAADDPDPDALSVYEVFG